MNIELKEKPIVKDERYKNNLKNLANQICNAHFGIKPTSTLQAVEEKRSRIIL